MRKLSGALALAVAAIGTSAAAQYQEIMVPGPPETKAPSIRTSTTLVHVQSRWYVGGEFGAMIVEDTNVDIGAVDNALRLNYDYGYDGGLFVGYDLGAFRIEAEAAYKKADLDSFNTLIQLPGEGTTFPVSREFAGGSASALSFMINGMLDFGDDKEVGSISGFVGGGIGMARVKANNQRVFANTAPFLDDSDSKLAWQVFAGVRQRVNRKLDVTVKYRFFNVDDVRMVAFNGNESEHRFRSHSLLGGITYRFGRTKKIEVREPYCESGWTMNSAGQCERIREIPVVICPPDPTHHPKGYVCPVGPFIVFFDWDRPDRREPEPYELSVQAMRVLDEAAAQYKRMGSVRIWIEAHTDTSGPDDYNLGLSDRRLRAVQSYLARHEVPTAEAQVRSYGERCPLVDSGDNVREPQNRRVELYYGDREEVTGSCPPSRNSPPAY